MEAQVLQYHISKQPVETKKMVYFVGICIFAKIIERKKGYY